MLCPADASSSGVFQCADSQCCHAVLRMHCASAQIRRYAFGSCIERCFELLDEFSSVKELGLKKFTFILGSGIFFLNLNALIF